MKSSQSSLAFGAIPLLLLAACGGPVAPDWVQITQGDPCASASAPPTELPAEGASPPPPVACEQPVFYLDGANIDVNGRTPYVILQTRYTDGRTGSIRAEANCGARKLEPTALKEDVFKDGAHVINRMVTLSAAEEKSVLEHACAKV